MRARKRKCVRPARPPVVPPGAPPCPLTWPSEPPTSFAAPSSDQAASVTPVAAARPWPDDHLSSGHSWQSAPAPLVGNLMLSTSPFETLSAVVQSELEALGCWLVSLAPSCALGGGVGAMAGGGQGPKARSRRRQSVLWYPRRQSVQGDAARRSAAATCRWAASESAGRFGWRQPRWNPWGAYLCGRFRLKFGGREGRLSWPEHGGF